MNFGMHQKCLPGGAEYFVGRFMESHFSVAAAKPCYESCVKTGESGKWWYLLSKEALRK